MTSAPSKIADGRWKMATQRSLPLRVHLRLPMLDIAAVRAALGVGEDDVLNLIEDGHLAWAWDIATKGAVKAEMRILAQTVVSYQQALVNGVRTDELPFAEVVKIVFIGAHQRPWLWGRELVRAFNCSSEHVLNLIREGSLNLLPGHSVPGAAGPGSRVSRLGPAPDPKSKMLDPVPGWRRGPGGSPCVALESVLRFMRERRRGGIT